MNDKHVRITNRIGTETAIAAEQTTFGSKGSGDEAAPLGDRENLEPLILESALKINTAGLLDIGMASFRGAQLEAVLGTDERAKVGDTTSYPWRCIASLLITARDDSQWIGTGWFVSPRVLITAGHCVYIKGSEQPGRDGWVKKIQVMPGRNGGSMGFGVKSATEFWSVKGWGDDGEEAYDYGAIILPDAFPSDLGTFGFAVLNDTTLGNRTINVAGYPVDKPQGTLWYDYRSIANLTADKVYYEADTAGGQSGAPVYLIRDQDKRVAVGIHAYGGASSNSATRISTQAYANILAWIALP